MTTNPKTRLVALLPVVGALAALATVVILSAPGIGSIAEPAALAFLLILVILLVLPHLGLAVILWRAAPAGWFWRSVAVVALLATIGQLLVGGVVLTGDDPQTPILLALYAPVQFAVVGVLLLAALLIILITSRDRSHADRDADERSAR